jgi:selenocysteine-specific elongation factor
MKHIVVGTAGHIDHGKSTLVRALTGIDPDRLKEEKERGITIELGFAYTTLDGTTVAFVDVPGHERFVKTMLAGVGGIDCVMLIVAADESVMPQTREHFDICRLLRVPQGLVVMTKADLVDPDTLEIVRLEIRDLVKGSFLEKAPVIGVSAETGAGLDELRTAILGAAGRVEDRTAAGPARLPIDRAFSMQGFGTVVTGTLVSGRVALEDELSLVPGLGPSAVPNALRGVRVRGLQVHGKKRAEAVAGERTAINLGGIDVSEIVRGQTLATPDALTVTRRVDAMFDLLPGAKRLKHGARVRFHHGTAEILGRVSVVGTAASEVAPGSRAAVRIRLESPAAVTRRDRFVLRAYSPPITIGGGEVLDPDPPRVGVRTATAASRFAAIVIKGAGQDEAALTRMIEDTGLRGFAFNRLVARAGIAPPDVAATIDALISTGQIKVATDRLVSSASVSLIGARLLTLVGDFHRANPLVDGIPREEVRERLFARAHAHVFELVLDELERAKKLVARDRLALAGHRLELSPEEGRAREAVEDAYKRAGLKPPDAATLAAGNRIAPALVEKMTGLLLRQKVLARVDTLVFHVDALQGLKSEVQALKTSTPGGRATVDVATFKDRYGITRKFAIPLLEWLDRERVTKRVGETRIVL